MNRRTFVVHVFSDGPMMLENLHTGERVAVSDLAATGPQIERWLATPEVAEERPAKPRADSVPGGGGAR